MSAVTTPAMDCGDDSSDEFGDHSDDDVHARSGKLALSGELAQSGKLAQSCELANSGVFFLWMRGRLFLPFSW